ncbi:MAG: TetR/AcrR family transcriptional regulator [Leptospirales bacterium]
MKNLFGKYAEENISEFSIRDIKYGRARLSVLRVFVDSIKDTNYEDIRIKDLCRTAEISEQSFYNYFPKKDDLFLYFISLWSVDVQLHAYELTPGVKRIYSLFEYTAKRSDQNPNLLRQVVAYRAKNETDDSSLKMKPVSLAEKCILFGNADILKKLPDQGIAPVLNSNLKYAKKNGEISPDSDTNALTLGLAAIFFGIPILTTNTGTSSLSENYRKAIQLMLHPYTKQTDLSKTSTRKRSEKKQTKGD